MDDRPKSVRHAQPELLIRILAYQKEVSIGWLSFDGFRTYALEVTVDYVVGVKNLEPVTDVEKLGLTSEPIQHGIEECDTPYKL